MKIILQMNVEELLCGTIYAAQPPQSQKLRKRAALINRSGVPAELAYAAVCRQVGCDCEQRLGQN